jgi:hypothetical protein
MEMEAATRWGRNIAGGGGPEGMRGADVGKVI